jgi:asparagine synthase (glutamine-hydrolysing)
LIKSGRVRALWKEHLDGRHNHQHLLWDILMLEAWRARWETPASTAA